MRDKSDLFIFVLLFRMMVTSLHIQVLVVEISLVTSELLNNPVTRNSPI